MSPTEYWLFSGDQPVTNATGVVITDEGDARRLAVELSKSQLDATISIVSRKREPAGEWTRTVARFRAGEEIPWQWRVDFHGYLMGEDHARLSAAGIFYAGGRSEISPQGTLREGYARHDVTVDAEAGEAAVEAVKTALGAKADECSEWHVRPAG